MKPISFEEHKELQTNILKAFATFCDQKGLKYFLAYGTLIGAVRHQGFIPWDDDTDVWMPRADYDQLIKIFNAEKTDPTYRLVAPFDTDAKHTYVKIIDSRTIKIEAGLPYKNDHLGIDIDVFPLDGEPDDDEEYRKWYEKLIRLYGKFYYNILLPNAGSWKRRLEVLLLKLTSLGKKENFLKKADDLHRLYPYENAKYIGSVSCLFSRFGDRFEKEWFEDVSILEYEGYSFKAPIGYDAVLTNLYGNYMQLPPQDQQVTHHANNVFWKENS